MYKDAEVPLICSASEQMNCLMEFGQPLPFVRILLQIIPRVSQCEYLYEYNLKAKNILEKET